MANEFNLCQICNSKPIEDAHHLIYGTYGADKDDKTLIAVCGECHRWCHKNKHESQEKYIDIAKSNWINYVQNS